MVEISMEFNDDSSGLYIADPDSSPFSYIPAPSDVRSAAGELILSPAGWRKIFAYDHDEESFSEKIAPEDTVIAGAAALSFADLVQESYGVGTPTVALAVDTRPTGPAIADTVARVLIAEGFELRYLFIAPAPEIMAYVKTKPELCGFIYISASHNPVGYNGIKFGLSDGAVIGGKKSKEAIDKFRSRLSSEELVEEVKEAVAEGSGEHYVRILEAVPTVKNEAMQTYEDFTRIVASGEDDKLAGDRFFTELHSSIEKNPQGILAELNGSARTRTIDEPFFTKMGLHYETVDNTPRKIVHPIVPEGKNLDLCKRELENRRSDDSRLQLGYVPDNDGDRGNIVYFDEKSGKAKAVEAQAVFALSVLSELASFRSKDEKEKLAVVINGPTSMRIERIAELLSAEAFRTETGEANVVAKAAELREEGYTVRILGEGSNGGNITHPATVRDPLNTLVSLIKLTANTGGERGPFALWCRKTGARFDSNTPLTIARLIESLPPFVTTGAYEPEAKLQIRSTDHALLKKHYEELFLEKWDREKKRFREDYGIAGFREINYEGTEAREGFGPEYRSGSQKGGMKIIFYDDTGRDTDFLWMRGSGTEPVFRLLADCEGRDTKRHEELLNWHRSLIQEADERTAEKKNSPIH